MENINLSSSTPLTNKEIGDSNVWREQSGHIRQMLWNSRCHIPSSSRRLHSLSWKHSGQLQTRKDSVASLNEHFTRRLSDSRKIRSHLHPEISLRAKRGVHILKHPASKRYPSLPPYLAILLRSQTGSKQMDRRIQNNTINVTLD